MKRFFLMIVMLLIFCNMSVMAFEFKASQQVYINQKVKDNIAIAASEIEVNEKIEGDLFAAGSNIEINSVITKDTWLVGDRIKIKGIILDDLRAAGRWIKLRGKIKKEVMLAGLYIDIDEECNIDDNCYLAAEEINIYGKIRKNLKARAKEIRISGIIYGDGDLKAEKIVFNSDALFKGNLSYSSKEKLKIPEGVVSGKVVWKRLIPEIPKKKQPTLAKKVFWFFVFFLALVSFGCAMILIIPKQVELIVQELHDAPLWSLLYGFIFLIFTPFLVIVLCITLIGIPIGVSVITYYFIGIYISKIFPGIFIGNLFLRNREKQSKVLLLIAMLIGVFLIEMTGFIPYLGWFFKLLAILFGLGALISSRFKFLKLLKAKELI